MGNLTESMLASSSLQALDCRANQINATIDFQHCTLDTCYAADVHINLTRKAGSWGFYYPM